MGGIGAKIDKIDEIKLCVCLHSCMDACLEFYVVLIKRFAGYDTMINFFVCFAKTINSEWCHICLFCGRD